MQMLMARYKLLYVKNQMLTAKYKLLYIKNQSEVKAVDGAE
jgi:hypothetical protein